MQKIIVLLTVLSAVFTSYNSSAQVRAIDKVIGKVGDDIILYSEVQGQILEMIQNKLTIDDETECTLTENFLYNALLLHQADVDSIEVQQEQVDAELDSKLGYYRNLLEQYNQTFESAYGQSELEWREELEEVLIKRNKIDQMQSKITANVTITPREVREFFNSIPTDSIPKINAQVEYSQIVIKAKLSEESEQIEIERLKKFKRQIESGMETFDYLAKTYSHDEATGRKGGSFDCVSKGMFVPEFDAMALSLEPGQISEPFKTQFGWHIVKVEERRGKTYCGRHILRVPLVSDANIKIAKERLDSLAKAMRADPSIDICAMVDKFSEDEQTKYSCGKVLNQMTGSTMWDISQLERETALLVDGLDVGDISDPFIFQTQDRKTAFKIVTVTKRTRPHIANLQDDYELLMMAALNEKKQEVIDEWVKTRINTSHVWISPDFSKCVFKYNWKKETAKAE